MTDNPDAVFEQAGEDIRRVVICNAKGLHARASAKFVQLAEQFDAEIAVRRDGAAVGGTSIMGLLMLAASQGCEIELAAQGPEAETALNRLCELVEDGFGENASEAPGREPAN